MRGVGALEQGYGEAVDLERIEEHGGMPGAYKDVRAVVRLQPLICIKG